ncbi:MAG: SMP-30/gluconolactonase/LRE family protein [Candidatus Humimicrobiaceae bacterium]
METVCDIKANLGEGPLWDFKNRVLYWIDIIDKKIFSYNTRTKKTNEITLDQHIGAMALSKSEELLLALQHGFYFFDMKKGDLKKISDPESHLQKNRFNDGKCDAFGRFWAGTTSFDEKDPVGSLYCLDNSLKVKKIFNEVIISNGITWSLDNNKMFYIDSPRKEVYSFDYDIASGTVSNKKIIIKVSDKLGFPDGMTIDTDGNLWIAHWGAYLVCKWNPDSGKLLEKIKIPVYRVSACTFGGENLDELFITTAQRGFADIGKKVDEDTVSEYDGMLFKIKTDSQGIRTFKFGF